MSPLQATDMSWLHLHVLIQCFLGVLMFLWFVCHDRVWRPLESGVWLRCPGLGPGPCPSLLRSSLVFGEVAK